MYRILLVKILFFLLLGIIHGNESIVGGKRVVPYHYPFSVSLVRNNIPYCGGVILSPIHVLTAASCVENLTDPQNDKEFDLRFGQPCLRNAYTGSRYIKNITIHPNYKNGLKNNNIAMITMNQSFPINVEDAPMIASSINYGIYGNIVGYGLSDEAYERSLNPNSTSTANSSESTKDYSDCAHIGAMSIVPGVHTLTCTDDYLCTAGDITSCVGQIGSPLFYQFPEEAIQSPEALPAVSNSINITRKLSVGSQRIGDVVSSDPAPAYPANGRRYLLQGIMVDKPSNCSSKSASTFSFERALSHHTWICSMVPCNI